MKTNQIDHSRLLPRSSSTAATVAQLPIAALIGGICFLLVNKLPWEAIVSAALLALSIVLVIVWQQSRALGRRRFLTALDAYAERQISQSIVPETERESFRTAADIGSRGDQARELATAGQISIPTEAPQELRAVARN